MALPHKKRRSLPHGGSWRSNQSELDKIQLLPRDRRFDWLPRQLSLRGNLCRALLILCAEAKQQYVSARSSSRIIAVTLFVKVFQRVFTVSSSRKDTSRKRAHASRCRLRFLIDIRRRNSLPSKMGRKKLKKKLQQGKPIVEEIEKSTVPTVPIDNLPEKFLWMHVKSGTKIRNVLCYALKEFPSYDSIVWTGTGYAIAKTISCAEIFKRKHEGLHQVTKLCYVNSEKSKEDIAAETRRIPEIHILLTKNIKDTSELGYQAPGDCEIFPQEKDAAKSEANTTMESTDNIPRIDEQFQTKEKNKKRKKMDQSEKNVELPSKKKKVP
ncbi:uncharacterized protein LOC105195567 [Solenopsis invicta]|uniref:uncharacterized protein LOC105195567 n=1 Tax=Solenopsis invicta TaxID=13686 RepID=UPI000E33E3AB|nr:uncharacterized protein LOC105195567 [Solenopsis invicta]